MKDFGGVEKIAQRWKAVGAVAVSVAIMLFTFSSDPSKADGPFEPTFNFQTSTTRAGAHPDVQIQINNAGTTDPLKAVGVTLPTGFMGALTAVDTKCTVGDAEDGTCPANTKIGTVDSTASVLSGSDESTVRLRGDIFLTDPLTSGDAAGLSIKVDAKVGSVEFPPVIVNAHAKIINNGANVRTEVTNIPTSVTDTQPSPRTINFHIDSMTLNLRSDLDGPDYPLFTNPTNCAAASNATAVLSSDNTISDTEDTVRQVSYQASSCSALAFDPYIHERMESTGPSDKTGVEATIRLAPGSSALSQVAVLEPSWAGANYAAFGSGLCPGGTAPNPVSLFNPSGATTATGPTGAPVVLPECPGYNTPSASDDTALFGTMTIETPLLPDPVVGNVYLISKTPLPWFGVDVNPSIPGNPPGVDIKLLGTTSLPQVDPDCDDTVDPYFCQTQVRAQFAGLPDVPITSAVLDLYDNTRAGGGDPEVLKMADSCQPPEDLKATLTPRSGTGAASRTQPFTMDTCDTPSPNPSVSIISPASGQTVSTSTVKLEYAVTDDTPAAPSCSIPNNSTVNLTPGPNTIVVNCTDASLNVGSDSVTVTRDDPPNTTITTASPTEGSSTADVTPTFEFTSSEGSSTFQCAFDGSAFLPCNTGSYTTEELFPGDLVHTFEVRAVDANGGVDLIPASRSFTVDVPFNPTFSASLTDLTARAHPNLDVTITNGSHDDLKDLTFSLPDGFLGGLTGVASLCPIANADVGTCAPGSKVGTVETEAIVDESIVRVTGDVFLTETRYPGVDPATLSIKIDPKIQDVVFDPIIVNARIKVRGNAQGIDTVAVSLPNSATNAIDGPTDFDLRKMVLKLRTNPGASYPLLTNPSACNPATAFSAHFTGASSATVGASQPVAFTGCNALGFSPSMSLAVYKTGTKLPPSGDEDTADLDATVIANPAEAGFSRAEILLPRAMTIDVSKLPGVLCTQEQLAADACQPSAKIGSVSALSPLLTEPLNGDVFLVKANGLPWIYLRLRGRLSVDLIGKSSFVNVSQIRTVFEGLPDAPISSFSLHVEKLFLTRDYTCSLNPATEWGAIGTLTGANGKTSPVSQNLEFDCPNRRSSIFSYKFKPKGKKSTLSATVLPQAGRKFKKVTLTLPKGVKFNKATFMNKKRLRKLVTISGNGRKLSTKCFKYKKSNQIEVGLCKKQVSRLAFNFKSGSLIATTKKKTLKLKFSTVDSANAKQRAKKN